MRGESLRKLFVVFIVFWVFSGHTIVFASQHQPQTTVGTQTAAGAQPQPQTTGGTQTAAGAQGAVGTQPQTTSGTPARTLRPFWSRLWGRLWGRASSDEASAGGGTGNVGGGSSPASSGDGVPSFNGSLWNQVKAPGITSAGAFLLLVCYEFFSRMKATTSSSEKDPDIFIAKFEAMLSRSNLEGEDLYKLGKLVERFKKAVLCFKKKRLVRCALLAVIAFDICRVCKEIGIRRESFYVMPWKVWDRTRGFVGNIYSGSENLA